MLVALRREFIADVMLRHLATATLMTTAALVAEEHQKRASARAQAVAAFGKCCGTIAARLLVAWRPYSPGKRLAVFLPSTFLVFGGFPCCSPH